MLTPVLSPIAGLLSPGRRIQARDGITFFGNGLGQRFASWWIPPAPVLGPVNLDLRLRVHLLQRRVTAFSQWPQVMPVTVKVWFMVIPWLVKKR
jgi:hypothetical protein